MKSKIVADGAKRRLDGDYARKRKEELTRQLYEEFAHELCEAGVLKRIKTKREIRAKVKEAMREEFDQGLHHLNLKVKP